MGGWSTSKQPWMRSRSRWNGSRSPSALRRDCSRSSPHRGCQDLVGHPDSKLVVRLGCENGSVLRRSHSGISVRLIYVQVITPLVMAQVLAVKECVAVAFHPGGGPATVTATTVTFCDGVNP